MTESQLDPATFDFDSWLEGVRRPRAKVTLYAREDLMAEIDEIVAELQPLDDKLRNQDGQPEQTMTEAGADRKRAAELRDRLRGLWGEYEKSGITFQLEQMPIDDYNDVIRRVRDEVPEPPADAPQPEFDRVQEAQAERAGTLTVCGCVKAAAPYGAELKQFALTEDGFAKLRKRFGVDQVSRLVAAARALTLEVRDVDGPFSRAVSRLLDGSTSG